MSLTRFGMSLLGASSLAVALTAGAAQAGVLTYELDTEFSGAQSPAGPTPWLTATFDDAADAIGANGVRLTMSTSGLVGSEFVDLWAFNFNPALDPTALSFTVIGAPTALLTGGAPSTGIDAFQADGDGRYDILFDWQNGPPGDRFNAGQTFVVDIGFTGAIDVTDFDFLSAPAGGHGPFTTAAHVQGIGTAAQGSGWIAPGNGNGTPIPEPAALSLLGIGLLGLGLLARRRRR
ncbi:PEP-CTERM sorting domain-containing protein [Desertibaculum subflavum]|uniref:PEP-CTERM sorting domain-containing protein n=1 Tax=Desertibaculum subflavum TaxID=2268458 RepID=UPI0013C3E78C